MKFDSWGFFENLSRKFKFLLISDKNNGHLWRENLCTFMIVSRWILLKTRNVLDKSFSENQNTHFMFNDLPPPLQKSCRLWDNVGKCFRAGQVTDDNIIWRMRFALCITKATDTHTEYVILIAFPRQLWLRGCTSILRYTYISRLDIKVEEHCRKIRFGTAA
jgi:hypothetical protein